MKADEAMSQSNPSSTTGKEAVMDVAPAVAVADAVEAQSLSHPNTTPGEEAKMVAVTERGEVSPSSTSTPTESPVKGGMGAKARKGKKAGKPAFDKNALMAERVKDSGYQSAVGAMFLKSVAAAKRVQHSLSERAYEHDITERSLAESATEAMQRLGRLLILCKYLGVDVDVLLERARLTMAAVKTRKPVQAILAAHQLAEHVTSMGATPPPEELRRDAKELLRVAKAGVARLKASEAGEKQLIELRQALAGHVKKSSDDLTLLTAELRHTDVCEGTNWTERILKAAAPIQRRVAAAESPVSNDPAAMKEAKGATG